MKKILVILFIIVMNLNIVMAYDGVILPYKEVSISSKLSSFINKSNAVSGQYVTTKDVLFELDDQKIKMSLQKNKLELEKLMLEYKELKNGKKSDEIKKAELSLELIKIRTKQLADEITISKKLFLNNGISKKELESKENALTSAKIQEQQAELDLKLIKNYPGENKLEIMQQTIALKKLQSEHIQGKLKNILIKSDFDGYIKEVLVNQGDFVSEGSKLAVMIDISKVYVEANIKINSKKNVELNNLIKIKIPLLNNKIFNGRVVSVYPEINSATNTVKIRILIDNPEHLIKPGMLVDLFI